LKQPKNIGHFLRVGQKMSYAYYIFAASYAEMNEMALLIPEK
jgi:hypothetical protein